MSGNASNDFSFNCDDTLSQLDESDLNAPAFTSTSSYADVDEYLKTGQYISAHTSDKNSKGQFVERQLASTSDMVRFTIMAETSEHEACHRAKDRAESFTESLS